MIPCTILGTGSALPPECIDNATLAARLGFDIPAEKIWAKTGIRTRHWASPGTTCASIGAEALRNALAMAGMKGDELRRVILTTSSGGDHLLPCTASAVVRELGLTGLDCFDLNNACGAFLWAFESAARYVAAGGGPVAVICTEIGSDIVDRKDPRTSLIFGDASGAAIVGSSDGVAGIEGLFLRTDTSFGMPTYIPHPRNTGAPPVITFRAGGREIVEGAVMLLQKAMAGALADAGLTLDDIDWVASHQPNGWMLDRILDDLEIGRERTVRVVDRIGSTGSAAIPFGLDRIARERGIAAGSRVMLLGVGGGVSYGALIVRMNALGIETRDNNRNG